MCYIERLVSPKRVFLKYPFRRALPPFRKIVSLRLLVVKIPKINVLNGLTHVIVFNATEEILKMRTYRIEVN